MADRRSGIGWLPVVFAVAALGAGGSDTRLADAARAGDIGAVDVLLQAGTAVDAPGPDGTTALHWAVYRDDAEMAARLVVAGADVDRTNRNGTTPLSLACVNANPTMVQHLLEAGADPSLPASGEPPLLTCARTGRVEAVERLLARGADPNATDDWKGQTAVMWATAEDHVAVVETLVAHGADVNMAATPGETALFVAVQLGLDDSVRALLAAGADVTVMSPGDAPLSHVAAAAGHHALGAELLEPFDAVGRWRTTDSGMPIDASGALPNGVRFDGPGELRTALLRRPEDFVGTFTRKLLTYAVGRGLEASDAPAVRRIVREAAAAGYPFSSIVAGIVRSEPFRMKVTRSAPPGSVAQLR